MNDYVENCLNSKSPKPPKLILKRDCSIDDNGNLIRNKKRKATIIGTRKKIKPEKLDYEDLFCNSPSINSCSSIKKYRPFICFVCGNHCTTYKITDHVKNSYKRIFGLEMKINSYSPDQVFVISFINLILF